MAAAGQKELDSAAIQSVIQVFEHASRAPGMWLGTVTIVGAENFITGFEAGLRVAFDITPVKSHRTQVEKNRGYPLKQIRERFPSELDAAREILTIELEAWKQLRDSTS